MKKSDLKSGMKVVVREGRELVLLDNFKHEFDDRDMVMVANTKNSWFALSNFTDDLKSTHFREHDIVKVYVPNHVYSIVDFFKDGKEYGYKLIWSRYDEEDKLEQEIKELEKQVKEKTEKLNKLKSR